MPVVGREHEREALSGALRGAPGSALLWGPAGVGKTTLLESVADDFTEVGWQVERINGAATRPGVAFGPFLHLVRNQELPAQSSGEQLTRLAAEVKLRVRDAPMVMLVDDAYLLDSESLLLVHQLVTRRDVTTLLAARSSEPLPQDIFSLVKDGHVTRVELPPLARHECDQLVALWLGGAVGSKVTDEIWRISEGNSLFVRELLAHGRASGTLFKNDADGWEVGGRLSSSPLLREVIGARLSDLATPARDFVDALAEAGPLSLATSEQLLALEGITELEDTGLVRSERVQDRDVVGLAHPLYEEVAKDLASVARLQLVRRRVASALDQSGADDSVGLLLRARLRLDAGDTDVRLYTRAAGAALQLLDTQLAIRCAEAALAAGADFDAERVYANALAASGRDDKADAIFFALAERADQPTRGMIKVEHAQRQLLSGRVSEAIGLLEDEIGRASYRDAVPMRNLLAYVLFFAGRLGEVTAVAAPLLEDRSVAVIPGVGSGYVSAQAIMGRAEHVIELVDRAFDELAVLELEPQLAFLNSVNFVWVRLLVLWQLGRAHEGDDPIGPLRKTTAAHVCNGRVINEAMPATQEFIRGHLDNAVAGHYAVAHYLETGVMQVATFNRVLLATVHALRGEPAKAQACLAFVDSTPPGARAGFEWWTDRARVLIHVAEGDVDHGIWRSLQLAADHAIECFHATTSLHDVVRLGRADLVVKRLARQVDRDDATWWDRVCSAHASAAYGEDGDALVAVSKQFEDGGLDLQACEAAAHAAHAYQARGNRLGQARATARVDELLLRCGKVRTPALQRMARILTPREYQVALLAAGGLSNADIAERLGTSARTVGNQLQTVYNKLDVHERSDLTHLLERRPLTRRPPTAAKSVGIP